MGVEITEIEGTITTKDGKTRQFRIESMISGAEWSQWGATNDALWPTTDVLEVLCDALNQHDFMADEMTEDDEEDED